MEFSDDPKTSELLVLPLKGPEALLSSKTFLGTRWLALNISGDLLTAVESFSESGTLSGGDEFGMRTMSVKVAESGKGSAKARVDLTA